MLPVIYARRLYRSVLHWWLHISIWMGILRFLAQLPGPAEFQAVFRLDGEVRSGGQGNCGDRNQLLVIEFCSISWLTWLIKPCAHNLYIPKHIPLVEFSPQALCAVMNIITMYLKTTINKSLSGPYKVNWVLGSFKASCLIKSGKTNGISNLCRTEIACVSAWKSWIIFSALNNLMKKVD